MQLKKIKSNFTNLLSDEVKIIFKIFDDRVRLVGGAVRNLIINKQVSDYDFATTLLPSEIIEILKKNNIQAISLAIKYGTIIAVVNQKNFEITTLRKDIDHKGRDCDVEFVDDYFVDASRRDFTANALYLDSNGIIYDFFNGIKDLKNSRICFIGNANQRIAEDYLRILRFFRFSCEYAKELDRDGLEACINNKNYLIKLSKERIRKEFLLMLASKNNSQLIQVLKIFNDEKIINEIISPYLDYKALEKLFYMLDEINFIPDLLLKIVIIFVENFRDFKKINLDFLDKICATNYEKNKTNNLLIIANYIQNELSLYGYDIKNNYENFIFKLKQIMLDHEPKIVSEAMIFLVIKNNLPIKNFFEIIEFCNNFHLPEFPLNGNDLLSLNIHGSNIGKALNIAKKFWLENNFNCEKSQLINYLKKFII
jgi:poly(A) polymerase